MTDTINDRSTLLTALRKRIKAVQVPDLGTVYIRRLSGLDVARLADAYNGSKERTVEENEKAIQCRIVQLALVNSEGERLFVESDLERIGELDRDILQVIQDEAIAYSGMGAGARSEAEKNSESIQTLASPSGSLVN